MAVTMPDKQERAQHKLKHIALRDSLHELIWDWYSHTGGYPNADSIMELMDWAREQCVNPEEHEEQVDASGH